MRVRGSSGVWELFIPGVGEGELYKYEIRHLTTKFTSKPTPMLFIRNFGKYSFHRV